MSLKKLHYYSVHTLLRMLPNVLHRTYARTLLSQFDKMSYAEQSELMARVHYYCQLQHPFPLDHDSRVSVRHFRKTGGNTYFFDLRKIIKGFCPDLEFCFINGDVTHVPPTPCFVKSRPIEGNRSNSVLLKLNAVRHYQFVDDPLPFDKKKDNLVWRGDGFWSHREAFIEQYFQHPLCDISRCDYHKAHAASNMATFDPFMPIREQLKSKFIVSLEGRDVATNLKWILASNSVCIMPKPKFETWFMEGLLQPGVHYVEIRDDYQDLLEKLHYYLDRPDEAKQIIHNANQWVTPFKNVQREHLLGLLVAMKYFTLSRQAEAMASHQLNRA